jgi:predicted nucleotide-binding protein
VSDMRSCDGGGPGWLQPRHGGGDATCSRNPQAAASGRQERLRTVFVVYGRNHAARLATFTFLRSIGLSPIEWSQALTATGKARPYIGEVIDAALETACAVVVLWTPDEVAFLRPEYADGDDDPEMEPSAQARPNVIFEAGFALGRAPDRVVLVELGRVRHFSDIVGRHAIRLSNSVTSRQEFVERLRAIGCAVDLSGTDWQTVGDFSLPPRLEPSHRNGNALNS